MGVVASRGVLADDDSISLAAGSTQIHKAPSETAEDWREGRGGKSKRRARKFQISDSSEASYIWNQKLPRFLILSYPR